MSCTGGLRRSDSCPPARPGLRLPEAFLLTVLSFIGLLARAHGSIPVPTHGMIAFIGVFSGGSVVEMVASQRYYNVVQFAIQVREEEG